MGVTNLWALLEPCGRRIDIQALRGRRLAIDASGWIFRFIKAMRDEKGELIPNAHLIGFFRRICKLLYHNIRPVFVFDGSTPLLKKQTVAERRRRRERQEAKVKKVAEKLLLNKLKQHLVTSAPTQPIARKDSENEVGNLSAQLTPREMQEESTKNQEQCDKDIENRDEESDEDSDAEDIEPFFPEDDIGLDPEVLATLPPSVQLEVMLRFRDKQVAANRSKFAERSTNPLEFSQYQMEQYLKASSLRQQLDMLRGVATTGAPIARPIAAVEGREYVLERLVTKDGPDHEDPNSNSAFVAKEREDREKPSSEVNQNLSLTFDVDIHEAEDEDVLWEDVDNECGGRETEVNEKRVSKSRFWSLSHGFKMGRQLGKWGEEENLTGDKINDTENDVLEDQNEDIELAIAIKRSLEDAPKENVPGTEILQHHLDGTQKEHVVNHADQEPAMPPHDEKLDDQVALCDSDLSLKIDGHAVETCKPIQDDPNRITSEITPELPLLDNSSPKDDRPPCDDSVSAPKEAMAPRIAVSVAQRSTFSPLSRISIGEKQKTLSSPRIATVSEAEILNEEAPGSDDVETKGKTVAMNFVEHYLDVGEKETNPAIIDPDWVDETDSIQITHGEDEMRQERLEEEGVNAAQAAQWEEQHFIDGAVLSKDISSLLAEEGMLRSEHRAAAGQADTPTDTMYNECQQLLQLFGIPYIIAPSEAEAQAAWLDVNGLVDGVVTDDNDALLFGAKRLYRNIFETSKYVEEYRSEDIEMELGLSREKLVFLAMLLGSDYTPGVAGVGVVNAVEIVLAFEGLDGLKGFADWVTSVDEQLVSLVRPSLVGNSASGTEPGEETAIQKQFKSTHKNVRKNWTLPPAFPSKEVVDAYLLPKVDDSMDKFQFARPDADLLRHFCYEHLGWGHSRVDELLVPVLQNYDERQRQQTLDSFLSYRQRFAKIRSKRLQNAVAGIRKTELDAETVYSEEKEQKSKRKSHSIEGKKSNKKAKVQNKNK